jgi:hypothetical protein
MAGRLRSLKMNLRSAISKINKRGILLVFPIHNKKDPPSLWYEFYPRTKMRWEWDDEGDSKVADLWHLREKLSSSRKVIYTKWFRGRATLISFDLFVAMLKIYSLNQISMTTHARDMLDLLNEDSPLSTKVLKRLSGLQGRSLEGLYTRALKELWSRCLIVGFGEVDEGAFPSLAIGSTKIIFENLWKKAQALEKAAAEAIINQYMPSGSHFRKYFDSTLAPASQFGEDSKSPTLQF